MQHLRQMKISTELQDKLAHHFSQAITGSCAPAESLIEIIKHIESELAQVLKVEQSRGRSLHRLSVAVEKLNTNITEQKEKEMIAQKAFDDSLQALTDAVTALSNPGAPSTPDTVVQAYISGVDTNTEHIKALAPTPTPPPTP